MRGPAIRRRSRGQGRSGAGQRPRHIGAGDSDHDVGLLDDRPQVALARNSTTGPPSLLHVQDLRDRAAALPIPSAHGCRCSVPNRRVILRPAMSLCKLDRTDVRLGTCRRHRKDRDRRARTAVAVPAHLASLMRSSIGVGLLAIRSARDRRKKAADRAPGPAYWRR